MSVSLRVAGSYIASWRPDDSSGKSIADGLFDPFLHHAGLSRGRIVDVIHTRPCESYITLWTLVWLVQMASSPQYADGCATGSAESGVAGSRTLSGTVVGVLCTGSRTGR